MANSHDPTDHFRTTHPHAGESFIDAYCWPGLLSIALGMIALVGCVAAAAYGRHEWILTTATVGVLAIAGGVAWLVLEHRRVLRVESRWRAGYCGSYADRRARWSAPSLADKSAGDRPVAPQPRPLVTTWPATSPGPVR
jgi:hypothetical protein